MLSFPVFHRCGPGLEEPSESQSSGTCGPGSVTCHIALLLPASSPRDPSAEVFYGDSVAESKGSMPFCFPFATNIQPL